MDFSALPGLLNWLADHPGLATAAIFLIAFCEGLVGAGLIIPGATLLFVAGALVGTGHLELWPSLIGAFAGAFIGDTVSFWLGRHYGDRLRTLWPLSRYPGALEKGERFFHAHGGKSVILGRFIGPIRGIIPAVAGMLTMPGGRFLAINFFSAFAWAPAYLLPGMVFGASLSVAASVTGRLVVLLIGGLALGWLAWWGVRRWIGPGLRRVGANLAWRTRRIERLSPWLLGTLEGPRQMFRALGHNAGRIWWLAVVAFGLLTFRQAVLGAPSLPDEALLGMLKGHLSVEFRSAFVLPAQLLEPTVWAGAWLAALIWALIRRRWRVAAAWFLAIPGAAALALAVGWSTGQLAAHPLYLGAPAVRFPSPSLSAFTALVLAGGVLATSGYGPLRRWVLLLGLVLLTSVAASAVVVGRLWLFDAVGGLLLGVIAAGGVVFARTASQERPPERSLPGVVGAVLLGFMVWQGFTVYGDERARFVAETQWPALTVEEWLEIDPTHAVGRELRWLDGGRRIVDVQWLGRDEDLARQIHEAGWVNTDRRLHGVLRWFQPEPQLERVLPPPRWHRGRLPDVIRVLPLDADGAPEMNANGADVRLVLRLWIAPVGLTDAPGTLWLATMERETVQAAWPTVRIYAEPVPPAQQEAVVAALLAESDLMMLKPGQPVRILPAEALQR